MVPPPLVSRVARVSKPVSREFKTAAEQREAAGTDSPDTGSAWACRVCTYENDVNIPACEMCGGQVRGGRVCVCVSVPACPFVHTGAVLLLLLLTHDSALHHMN